MKVFKILRIKTEILRTRLKIQALREWMFLYDIVYILRQTSTRTKMIWIKAEILLIKWIFGVSSNKE